MDGGGDGQAGVRIEQLDVTDPASVAADDLTVNAVAADSFTLTDGDSVTFDVEQGQKGPAAVNVTKL